MAALNAAEMCWSSAHCALNRRGIVDRKPSAPSPADNRQRSLPDVRSSDALEDAASEFEVQGLELDWTCVCWDANFIRANDSWGVRQFKGTAWQQVSDANRQRYVANSYRVLLTRARQGMVIFVPPGDHEDVTRPPAIYDGIFDYLRVCGIPSLVDG